MKGRGAFGCAAEPTAISSARRALLLITQYNLCKRMWHEDNFADINLIMYVSLNGCMYVYACQCGATDGVA